MDSTRRPKRRLSATVPHSSNSSRVKYDDDLPADANVKSEDGGGNDLHGIPEFKFEVQTGYGSHAVSLAHPKAEPTDDKSIVQLVTGRPAWSGFTSEDPRSELQQGGQVFYHSSGGTRFHLSSSDPHADRALAWLSDLANVQAASSGQLAFSAASIPRETRAHEVAVGYGKLIKLDYPKLSCCGRSVIPGEHFDWFVTMCPTVDDEDRRDPRFGNTGQSRPSYATAEQLDSVAHFNPSCVQSFISVLAQPKFARLRGLRPQLTVVAAFPAKSQAATPCFGCDYNTARPTNEEGGEWRLSSLVFRYQSDVRRNNTHYPIGERLQLHPAPASPGMAFRLHDNHISTADHHLYVQNGQYASVCGTDCLSSFLNSENSAAYFDACDQIPKSSRAAKKDEVVEETSRICYRQRNPDWTAELTWYDTNQAIGLFDRLKLAITADPSQRHSMGYVELLES